MPEVEELGEGDPREVVLENARRKARAGRAAHPDALVIGGDTEVVVEGRLLGKAADEGEARSHLQTLSGREHEVLGGLVLLGADGSERAGVVSSRVTFKPAGRRHARPLRRLGRVARPCRRLRDPGPRLDLDRAPGRRLLERRRPARRAAARAGPGAGARVIAAIWPASAFARLTTLVRQDGKRRVNRHSRRGFPPRPPAADALIQPLWACSPT